MASRYTGRRAKTITFGTFDDAIGEINGGPEVWFPFEEASGTLGNSGGSDPVAFDLDNNDAGPVEYAQTGVTGAGSAVTIGARGNYLRTLDELSDINSGSASATGTLLFVFRDNWVVGDSSTIWLNGSLNLDHIRLYVNADGGLNFQTIESGGSTAQYQYIASFSAADQATHDSHVRNGDWHMFAVVQSATTKTYYLDGAVITPTTETIGASTDDEYWVHDSTAGSMTFGTHPTLAASHYWFGHLDEFAYWDGYEVTASEITNLWGHLSPNASTNGAREGILYVLWDLESGLPKHVYDQKNGTVSLSPDRGSAATKTTAATYNATPSTLRAPGMTGDGTSFISTASTYTSGDGIRHGRPDAADLASMATGYILIHWKPDAAAETNGWSPAVFSIEVDEDTATEPGAVRWHMLQDGRPFFQILQDDGVNWDYQATFPVPSGAHITDDEVWQQMLIYQPADGNGVRGLHNGQFIDFDEITHTPGAGTGDDIDAWLASASDNWAGSSKLSIGGLTNTAASMVNGMGGNHGLCVVGAKSDWSEAQLARVFAASGITA